MTTTAPPKAFKTPQALGAWFRTHHATEKELLIRLYKVHARHLGIGYKEALDEALCWGWIDGVVRRLDADSYQQRFTPRKPKSIWSNVNVRHVERLTSEGRMEPPGLAAFEARTPERTGIYSFEKQEVTLAPAFLKRLKADKAAWAWYSAQGAYYRRTAAHWVMSAKREETRERRFAQLLGCSHDGLRVPPLRPA